MTRARRPPMPGLDADPLDAAVAFALLGGVLSLLLPYFVGLTFALSGLVLAIALVRRRPRPDRPGRAGVLHGLPVSLASFAVGWGFLFGAPPGLAPVRGLLLALATLPLWRVARRPGPFGGA